MNKYAVVTSYGRDCFYECIEAIAPQVDEIFVIGHNFTPEPLCSKCTLVPYDVGLPNISTMWNLGIKAAGPDADFVAILNDDAIVGPDWFSQIVDQMETTGAVLGCMAEVGRTVVQTPHSPDLPRLTGFAYVLDAHAGLLLDEQFQWWWGDTDLDWRARHAGGTVIVPGTIEHRYPNGTTVGLLAEIAGEDRGRFVQKWGSAPW